MNSGDVVTASERMYKQLSEVGMDVLFDDRANITPGFKFKDADLLGMPFQIIIGDKGLKNGQIEIKRRRTGERMMVKLEDAVTEISKLLAE
jgi:prolyl-tRNA synthetase